MICVTYGEYGKFLGKFFDSQEAREAGIGIYDLYSGLTRKNVLYELTADSSVTKTLFESPGQGPADWRDRVSYLMTKADFVLVDTETLESSFSHELLWHAHGRAVPCWAVGSSPRPILISSLYLKGVLYPVDHAELVNFILRNVREVSK